MANATVSRLGQSNLAGSTDALFLKVFAGEVLTAFATRNVFMARTLVRTISSGLSAQFPATWKGTAGYHTPGNELVGSTVAHAEQVITIDDLLVADRFIAKIDEAKNHYDVRSIYSRDVGMALSDAMDTNIALTIGLTARASASVTGGSGGTAITSANSKTDADTLITALFDAAQALDEKDVPDTERYVALKPDQYYLLIQSGSKAINRDYGNEGNGSMAAGEIFRIAGMEIVKTNHLPVTNVATGLAKYQGNFSTTSALVWQRQAVGTVKLLDLSVDMNFDFRRRGTLIVAEYAMGHGKLRPECAVEVKTA